MDVNTIAWLILLLPLASAAVILLGTKKSAGISSLIATGSVLATLVLSFLLLRQPDDVVAKPNMGGVVDGFKQEVQFV